MTNKAGAGNDSLKDRGLIEIRVCLPIELCERMDAIVKEKLEVKEARRRAKRRVPSDRISRSSEVSTAVERFVREYERNRERHGPPTLPPPPRRGRPRKQKPE